MERELSTVSKQVVDLTKRGQEERALIRRLDDPQGSVPEIHARLRYVRPNEKLVILEPAPSPAPSSP